MLWTVCKGLKIDDIVLCSDGNGEYYIGTITSNYYHKPGEVLPHRRSVNWLQRTIRRIDMSQELQHSTGLIGTCCDITKYETELEVFINNQVIILSYNNEEVEDPSEFAMEEHLEEFLVENWNHTPLGRAYDIYEDNGELIGVQYQSDTGPIDILG